MTERSARPKGVTSPSLLIQILTAALNRVDYASRKVLPQKSILFDLLMAAIFLLRYMSDSERNKELCLEYTKGIVGCALARLNNQPIAFYKVESYLNGRSVFSNRDIPEAVDPHKYIEAMEQWRNLPDRAPIKSICKLTPEEMAGRDMPWTKWPRSVSDSEKWVADYCRKAGITDALAKLVGPIKSFGGNPNPDKLILSVISKSEQYSNTNVTQRYLLSKLVGGTEANVDVWIFTSLITIILVDDQIRGFLPSADWRFPDRWDKSLVVVPANKSDITFQVLRAELQSSAGT